MKKLGFLLILVMVNGIGFGQSAPSHLKYFGYAIVDCLWDDPHDSSAVTNYIAEVDTFSNIAHLCAFSETDNVVARVGQMTARCVKPMLHIQTVFYETVNGNAPSGENYDLRSDFSQAWTTFKSVNASILDTNSIAAIYLVDEPYWNGLTYPELDTVCKLVEADYPDIPIVLVEAYPILDSFQVPVEVDWIGFDKYGVLDPSTDPGYLADLAKLKSKISSPNQRVVIVAEDQWLPIYGQFGVAPDSIRSIFQNYYNLAASDPDVIGMLNYLWAGGLDDPGQLGTRNLPQSVLDKNVEIGQMIKANYNPCVASGGVEKEARKLLLFPNPAATVLRISLEDPLFEHFEVAVYNHFGQLVHSNGGFSGAELDLDVSGFAEGVYFVEIVSTDGSRTQGKFVVAR